MVNKLIVYISGPMRGLPDFNRPAFDDAARRYRAAGAIVFNPCGTFGGDMGIPFERFMEIDLAAVRASDLVVFLPGWQNSEGAMAEYEEANKYGVPNYVDVPGGEAEVLRVHRVTQNPSPRVLDSGVMVHPQDAMLGPPSLYPGTRPWRESGDLDVGTPEGLPTILDSGTRNSFSTGSVRDSAQGKGRWDLLPYRALRRVALIYEAGARKYGDRNWELGQDFSRVSSSAMHHLFRWLAGCIDEDHLAMAAWNLLALLEFEERIKEGALPSSLADTPGAAERLEVPAKG